VSAPERVVSSLEERRAAILEIIGSARSSIALSLFRCNDEEVFAELANATARGVRVEALVTSRAKGGKKKLKKLWDRLTQTGAVINAYADPVVKYHAKYLIVDDTVAVVASCNLTRKCFERTCDALVVTRDPAVVGGLRELMTADREQRRFATPLSPRLLIGPDTARAQFTRLLSQARSSIQILDAKLSDPEILNLLDRRRAEGLRVQVFGAKRLGTLMSHGKILLIDECLAVVGSLALSALGLDFRREVSILVDDPAGVAQVADLFRGIESLPSVSEAGTDAPGAVL
jgi:phosphatidylserine/phosphatidylglycerophosphate/cardiolipin synthase-like enzyme